MYTYSATPATTDVWNITYTQRHPANFGGLRSWNMKSLQSFEKTPVEGNHSWIVPDLNETQVPQIRIILLYCILVWETCIWFDCNSHGKHDGKMNLRCVGVQSACQELQERVDHLEDVCQQAPCDQRWSSSHERCPCWLVIVGSYTTWVIRD